MSSIFERQKVPLASAPLYYLALADLAESHINRLALRLARSEPDALSFLNLFRGEAMAFQGMVVKHIDQRAKSKSAAKERKEAVTRGAEWVGTIRRGGALASRTLKQDKKLVEKLKSALHIGRALGRTSAGQVLLEVRYLDAVLPGWKDVLSPPLHEAELTRGALLAEAIEMAVFGRVRATAEQADAAFAKSKAWDVLEDKSIQILHAARLEFSKEPDHADYPIRIEFEGLDEKFAPQRKKEKKQAAPKDAPPQSPPPEAPKVAEQG